MTENRQKSLNIQKICLSTSIRTLFKDIVIGRLFSSSPRRTFTICAAGETNFDTGAGADNAGEVAVVRTAAVFLRKKTKYTTASAPRIKYMIMTNVQKQLLCMFVSFMNQVKHRTHPLLNSNIVILMYDGFTGLNFLCNKNMNGLPTVLQ